MDDYVVSTSRLAPARSARISVRICSISAVRIPCFVWAARIRAKPSGVRGPVLSPPGSRQRRLRSRHFVGGWEHASLSATGAPDSPVARDRLKLHS